MPFDRAATMLDALAAMSDVEVDRVAGLGLAHGPHFEGLVAEVRQAVQTAVRAADQPGARPSLLNLTGHDIYEAGGFHEPRDADILTYFDRVGAAHEYNLTELPFDTRYTSNRMLDVLGYVLAEVYQRGLDQLHQHLAEIADDAELDAEDSGETGDGSGGVDDLSDADLAAWEAENQARSAEPDNR